ncbi:cis-prenyltransferase [Dipsacomyces acuminosporus]|nr:cis-prenyltransferase [Dipsacomyces acuminosporus]
MDGNRRFARKTHLALGKGHEAGFDRLADVLQWCNKLGVKQVSVYAFAINNFNRPKDEVDTLMSLVRNRLPELVDRSSLLELHDMRIRAVGDRELLPEDVRESIEHVERITKDNKGMTLNICSPYAATDEITFAIRTLAEAVDGGNIRVSEIDESVLESKLQISSPDLDILVRTSGQIRFSNFMLWQSSKMAFIQFVNAYWPEFSLRHLLYIIVSWQHSFKLIEDKKRAIAKIKQTAAAATAAAASASKNP